MVSLTDTQLAIVTQAAQCLPVEKRDIYLRRIGAMLAVRRPGRDRTVGDDVVSEVATLALCGLVQTADVA
jgi:hypothetical protein